MIKTGIDKALALLSLESIVVPFIGGHTCVPMTFMCSVYMTV